MRQRSIYVYDTVLKRVIPVEQSRLHHPHGSRLTKFERDANELCHDVLKPDIRDMIKSGEIRPVPGASLFGHGLSEIMGYDK